MSLSLQQVGPVDTGSPDRDADVVRSHHGRRCFADLEDIFFTRLLNHDCAHAGSLSPRSAPGAPASKERRHPAGRTAGFQPAPRNAQVKLRTVPSETPAISCRDLRKYYPDVKAVDGLDLSVGQGECFGLLGPNGAGKTTTIEILEGLTRPDSGVVELLGLNWKTNQRELRERIGISLQETQLSEKLSVLETLTLFRSFYRNGPDPADLLRDLSLDEKANSRVGKLSGGQKQRLAVACALAGDPDILFLDEPTTGLDPQSRLELWDVVGRFRARGGTVLLTTHYMEEAQRLCDRVAIVDHGHLIALGTPKELIAKLDAPNIIEFTSEPALSEAALGALSTCHGCSKRGDGWQLRVDSLAEAVPQLLAMIEKSGGHLKTLTTHEATLEDLFVSLTGRELRDA
jgi:ABC-2 type transport system ATP-binding protein